MLSTIINKTETSSLTQLGGNGGIRFLGSAKGVLPIGPDGVPAFNNLETSPFSDEQARQGMVSYNYTLIQQGLDSNITCIYDPTSPIRFRPVPGSGPVVLQYNGTCDPEKRLAPVLDNVETYMSLNTNNTLGFWACKSTAEDVGPPVYTVYLRGSGFYAQAIGNITCTISPQCSRNPKLIGRTTRL